MYTYKHIKREKKRMCGANLQKLKLTATIQREISILFRAYIDLQNVASLLRSAYINTL